MLATQGLAIILEVGEIEGTWLSGGMRLLLLTKGPGVWVAQEAGTGSGACDLLPGSLVSHCSVPWL
jgi:hypothetical protein